VRRLRPLKVVGDFVVHFLKKVKGKSIVIPIVLTTKSNSKYNQEILTCTSKNTSNQSYAV